ncbi:MAG TPA: zf-HC2 domain-containing protein [Thermoanaerobaculia bacterium]|nr:zf-HC2 domain-containing protein [Thermoanaerobaculia bacterium]
MDHAHIEEQHVVDRYVRGTLPAEEAARFEEHYLSCQTCLDQLDLAEAMKRGFQRAAGQDAVKVAAVRQLALVAWLFRLGRSRQAAVLVMTLLVAVLLPWGWAARKLSDRDRELAQERQERSAASGRTSAEREAIQRELDRESKAHAKAVEELKQALQPQGNVPILQLGVERGVGGNVPVLYLPATPGLVVLNLSVEQDHRYHVVLRDAKGKEIWSGNFLSDNTGTLNLAFHSSLLAPGDYTLTAAGVGRFPFHAVPQ